MSTNPITRSQPGVLSPSQARATHAPRRRHELSDESADGSATVTDLVNAAMAASTPNIIAALEDLLALLKVGADSRAQLAQLPSQDLLTALATTRARGRRGMRPPQTPTDKPVTR